MSVRLKVEDSRDGLMATLSQRDEAGKMIGKPSVFLVESKEMAKQRARTLARSLSLKTYGIVDKTVNTEAPPPWLVPGAGNSI
jgi:hypothetical protein